MFETSHDILNWVLAVSVATLVFFISWSLYYFIASAQRIFRLIKHIESGVAKAEELLDILKGKVSSSASYLAIFGELLKRGIDMAKERRFRYGDEEKKSSGVKTKKKK